MHNRIRAIHTFNPFKPFSIEHKNNISKNHANTGGKNNGMFGIHRFGKDNPCAKTWLLINHNTNKVYKLVGNVEIKCKELNLSYNVINQHKNKGIITKSRAKISNHIGWEIKRI